MKSTLLFAFTGLIVLTYLGCKKGPPSDTYTPLKIYYLTDTIAGTYVLSGLDYSNCYDPFNQTSSTYTSIVPSDTMAFTKVDQYTLSASDNAEYLYSIENSQGDFNCYCSSFSEGSRYGYDTIWFLKANPDSIKTHYFLNEGLTTFCQDNYYLHGRKIH